MNDRLNPYPAYQDSGLPWLGPVPAHWETRRLRASIQGCINGIWGSEPNGQDDLVCIRVADFDRQSLQVRLMKPTMRAIAPRERQHRMLKKGDLLLEKSGGGEKQLVGAVVHYNHDVPAVSSNFIARMPVVADFDSIYLTYLHSYLYAIHLNIRSIKQTIGIQNLDSSAYLSEVVAFPPPNEQRAIAAFLSYHDRLTRRYIRAQQRLVALLSEQKQALIQQAVTRGLPSTGSGQAIPDAPLKDSGIEWLGDVPECWKVVRIKNLLQEVDERSSTGQETLLSLRMNYGLVPHDEHFARPGQASTLVGYKLVRPGQVVLNKLQANNGLVFASEVFGLVSPDYAVFNPIADVDLQYLTALFRTPMMKYKFRVEAKGLGTGTSGFLRLYTDRFEAIPIPLPPRNEQSQIMCGLDELLRGLENIIERTHRQIALVREYRTRLVADVVTGKLDVRGVALPADQGPDEADDLVQEIGETTDLDEQEEDDAQE